MTSPFDPSTLPTKDQLDLVLRALAGVCGEFSKGTLNQLRSLGRVFYLKLLNSTDVDDRRAASWLWDLNICSSAQSLSWSHIPQAAGFHSLGIVKLVRDGNTFKLVYDA